MQKYRVEVNDNGSVRWYKHGTDKLHRIDGPAVEHADGTKCWFQNGKLHRTDGPAIEYADGDKCWYQNGKLHRLDGPAVEYANGYRAWYQNGKSHRTDGPAIEWANGDKHWYIKGKNLSEKEFLQQTSTCNGKVIGYEGKKYKLQLVEE